MAKRLREDDEIDDQPLARIRRLAVEYSDDEGEVIGFELEPNTRTIVEREISEVQREIEEEMTVTEEFDPSIFLTDIEDIVFEDSHTSSPLYPPSSDSQDDADGSITDEEEEEVDIEAEGTDGEITALRDIIVSGDNEQYADYPIRPNSSFPEWVNKIIIDNYGDIKLIKEKFYQSYEKDLHIAYGDKWSKSFKYSILLDNGTNGKRHYENASMSIKQIDGEQVKQFLTQLLAIIDFVVCLCTKTTRGCIDYPHFHIILITSKDYQATRFRDIFNKHFGCEHEFVKKKVRKYFYRKMKFQSICSNMSPWCGLTNYLAVGSIVAPDFASGQQHLLNPICKKDLKFHTSLPDSLYSCIYFEQPTWYISFKHRLTTNHLSCFENQLIVASSSEASPFHKIYTFFAKYGCIEASTVHIKLGRKDYEQFTQMGMNRQWNKALERWVNDKIQHWDWRNFHNTLAPLSDEVFNTIEDSHTFLKSLLRYQGYNDVSIPFFCSALYEIMNKTSQKRNCFYLWGVSSSGKTLILNIIKKIMVRYGVYTEQGGQFAFSEASYRTCFCFEDVSQLPLSTLSTIKRLWEGEEALVNIKYRNPVNVYRTPCFVTSNYSLDAVFSKEQSHSEMLTLSNRMFQFHFPNSFQFSTSAIHISPYDFIRFIDDNRIKDFNVNDNELSIGIPTYNMTSGSFEE